MPPPRYNSSVDFPLHSVSFRRIHRNISLHFRHSCPSVSPVAARKAMCLRDAPRCRSPLCCSFDLALSRPSVSAIPAAASLQLPPGKRLVLFQLGFLASHFDLCGVLSPVSCTPIVIVATQRVDIQSTPSLPLHRVRTRSQQMTHSRLQSPTIRGATSLKWTRSEFSATQ